MKNDVNHPDLAGDGAIEEPSCLSPRPYCDLVRAGPRRFGGAFGVQWVSEHSNAVAAISPGDVLDWREDQPCDPTGGSENLYGGTLTRADFANCPSRQNILTWNTTHVAVGFTDLSTLLRSKFEDSQQTQAERWSCGTGGSMTAEHDRKFEEKPRRLKWIGIDASAFAVAKAEVINTILVQEGASPTEKEPSCLEAAMQVWLSATWSRTTLRSFHRACKDVYERMRREVGDKEADLVGVP